MLADLLEDAIYKYFTSELTTAGIAFHKGFSFDKMEPPCVGIWASTSDTTIEPESLSERITVEIMVYSRAEQTRASTVLLSDKVYSLVSKYDLALNLNNQNISGLFVNQYVVNGYNRDIEEDRIRRIRINLVCDCCTTGSLTQNHNAK